MPVVLAPAPPPGLLSWVLAVVSWEIAAQARVDGSAIGTREFRVRHEPSAPLAEDHGPTRDVAHDGLSGYRGSFCWVCGDHLGNKRSSRVKCVQRSPVSSSSERRNSKIKFYPAAPFTYWCMKGGSNATPYQVYVQKLTKHLEPFDRWHSILSASCCTLYLIKPSPCTYCPLGI